MSREDPQMKIRLPAFLKDQIQASSEKSGHSMNAEIVGRLQSSFTEDAAAQTLSDLDVERIAVRVAALLKSQ